MGGVLPIAGLITNALVWGLSWWPFRELSQAGSHPLWSTFFIYGLSLVGVVLIWPASWRLVVRFPMLFLLALAAGLTNVGFNWAVTIGDVVRVVLLFYLMPAWVALLAWPLLGEKPSPVSLLRLVIALAGVVIVLKTPESPWPVPADLADWLALMGGLCFALTNILLRKLNHTPDEGRMLAMFGGGALVPLMVALVLTKFGSVLAPPSFNMDWAGVALVTSLAFLVGNVCLQYGAARLSASATSLIMLTELLFASGSSVFMGAGELTLRSMIGGALILLAALWASWPTPVKPALPPAAGER
jgi:drug/metabolite transporter (DMT)-like permease